jgi:hypothetical protein
MTTRILLRSPKDPFEVVSPRAVYHRNLIGNNAGNLIFLHAAHRLLAVRDAEIEAGGMSFGPGQATAVNERFDVFVLPLANAFRNSFRVHLERMTRFIERLTIPVVVLGVGAQSDARYDFGRIRPIEDAVRRFVTAVLERAPSIGVRGELTADYLQTLGFRDVEVIGCPSMFLHGDRLDVLKRQPGLDAASRISINVSPYVKAMGPIVMSHLERYPNLTYVAQDRDTLGLLLRGPERPSVGPTDDPIPRHASHPLFRQRRVRFYVEPWPWIDDLRQIDFSFGTRIHGNIAALLAGTPAYVFAHDSRTLELARYFAIPHRPMKEVPPDVDAAQLYAEADFTSLVDGHAGRFARFTDYLAKHGLRHVFEAGERPQDFVDRLAATRFPPAVTVSTVVIAPDSLTGRIGRRWHRLVISGTDRLTRLTSAGWRVWRRVRKRIGRD